MGENLKRAPAEGATYDFGDDAVLFKPVPALVTENAQVQRTLFKRNLDEAHEYEVLVVGSGIGGGILADQLADLGADVLVLEAGSYLFPTHVANLPRRLRVGRFDKSVWGLFPDFSFANYVNVDGSAFAGRQAFNLGGRSVFWGGLIPRMGPGAGGLAGRGARLPADHRLPARRGRPQPGRPGRVDLSGGHQAVPGPGAARLRSSRRSGGGAVPGLHAAVDPRRDVLHRRPAGGGPARGGGRRSPAGRPST